MTQRFVFLIAGVLIVWGSLGYRIISDKDPAERILALVFGVGVTVLAVLISRGPLLTKDHSENDE